MIYCGKGRLTTAAQREMEAISYHCGQGINDCRTPPIAVVNEALGDGCHVIVTPSVLPTTAMRRHTAKYAIQGLTGTCYKIPRTYP